MSHLLECIECGEKVAVPSYRVKTFKFCSRACGAKHARVRSSSLCAVCSRSFDHISSRCNRAKYCSRSCYYKAMAHKGTKQFTCKHCGNTFLGSPSQTRVYCSRACNGKDSKSKWNPKFSTVRKAMVGRGMIQKCERCGFDSNPRILGVHHKDRNRSNNDLGNLEVLCPNCHSMEHERHLPHPAFQFSHSC